jgi:hypothetical protein
MTQLARWLLAPALLWLTLTPPPAQAQSEGRVLTRSEIREAFIGNTIVSAPESPQAFSEFHAPGGQVYGSNGTTPNQNACWRQQGNRICYAYGPNELCYLIVRHGRSFDFIANDVVMHRAQVRRGDALRLAGRPQPWSCPFAGVAAKLNH